MKMEILEGVVSKLDKFEVDGTTYFRFEINGSSVEFSGDHTYSRFDGRLKVFIDNGDKITITGDFKNKNTFVATYYVNLTKKLYSLPNTRVTSFLSLFYGIPMFFIALYLISGGVLDGIGAIFLSGITLAILYYLFKKTVMYRVSCYRALKPLI